ncbi:MAG: acyl-CoA dehydrogenase family protein [Pseudomonadota bacterium]
MDYGLTEEQQLLRDSAHNFLSKECTSTFIRETMADKKGYSPEMWQKMSELGWLGIMFPEQYGGVEGSFVELAVLLYEMGYFCLPSPYFSTVVSGGLTLLEAAGEKQKQALLPEIAAGKRILTLAWTEAGGSWSASGIELAAKSRNSGYVLSGTKLFVPFAQAADTLVCAARTGAAENGVRAGISLFLVDGQMSGLETQALETLAADKPCEVVFSQVVIPADNLLGDLDQGWPVLEKVRQMAAVAKCAEMSGGAQRVIDLVVPYTKERIQFGQPIGSFQAVKHHCADMLTLAETSRFMTYQAAWQIIQGVGTPKEASKCKAWVSDSYRRLAALGHQVMGGIGFMEEHDLQLYFKQAKAAELAFGDADFHRELMAGEMGL